MFGGERGHTIVLMVGILVRRTFDVWWWYLRRGVCDKVLLTRTSCWYSLLVTYYRRSHSLGCRQATLGDDSLHHVVVETTKGYGLILSAAALSREDGLRLDES